MIKMKLKIDSNLISLLKEGSIFTKRTGIRGKYQGYVNRLNIGDELHFCNNCLIEEFSTIDNGNNFFTVGSFSSIRSSLHVDSKVNRYVSIGPNVKQFGFRHPIEAVSSSSAVFSFGRENVAGYFQKYEKLNATKIYPEKVPTPQPHQAGITIGADVWIASDVVIKGGVKIGNGAIVAQGSLVTKDIEPYSIVGGVPAKLIKKRFPKEIIEELEKTKWWEYELGDMYREKLDFSDPYNFIKKFNERVEKISRYKPNVFSPYIHSLTGQGVIDYGNYLVDKNGLILFYDVLDHSLALCQWEDKSSNQKSVWLDKENDQLKIGEEDLSISQQDIQKNISTKVKEDPFLSPFKTGDGRITIKSNDEHLIFNSGDIKRTGSEKEATNFLVLNSY